ncbi:Hypothetical Protein FCC1311_073712 [Hondaea fermentalgiana]|uniref:Uncharacterized protein n=1 Tax=Hondaea fermentalgiana TaxID=2315210 RepID=A0A2R5GJT6_9STRA|nr:Hypothetical Protein FCC1311_073712 [Hondaea fermentalgiana]|eukprot:GBG31150.1 Hypothetical Protein FCC1311_073712 [Hondaea fermentalgiana]
MQTRNLKTSKEESNKQSKAKLTARKSSVKSNQVEIKMHATNAMKLLAMVAAVLVATSDACGLKNSEPCKAEIPCRGGLTAIDGTCQPCGSSDQPICPEPNTLACRGATIDIDGTCAPCGGKGKPLCATSQPCSSGLAPNLKDGLTCSPCGAQNQPMCTGENELSCDPLYTPSVDGSCVKCGFEIFKTKEQLAQCAITGHYLAEEFDGGSAEAANRMELGKQQVTLTFTPLGKPGEVTDYIVTKTNTNTLASTTEDDHFKNIDAKPMLFSHEEIGFKFPFYGRVMENFCISPQGFVSFVDKDSLCKNDVLEAGSDSLLRLHYNQPRVSAYFAKWKPADCSAKDRPNGCVRTFLGKREEDNVAFLKVFYSQVTDYDEPSTIRPQLTLLIHEDGLIQIRYPWGQSGYSNGVVGLSPITDRFQGKYADQVSFTVETCYNGFTAQPDGTCARD